MRARREGRFLRIDVGECCIHLAMAGLKRKSHGSAVAIYCRNQREPQAFLTTPMSQSSTIAPTTAVTSEPMRP